MLNKQEAITVLTHALLNGEQQKAGILLQDLVNSLGQAIWQEAEIIQLMAVYRLLMGQPATAIALIGRFLQHRASLPPHHPVTKIRDKAIEARLYQTLGRALLAEGQIEPARMAFSQSLALLPEEAASQAGMGEVLMILGKLEQALPFLKKARNLASKEPAILMLLSQCYMALGYDRGAGGRKGVMEILDVFRTLIVLLPQNGLACANLGAVLFSARPVLLRETLSNPALSLAETPPASEPDPLEEAGCYLLKACLLGAGTVQTLTNLGLVRLGQGFVARSCLLLQQAAQQVAEEHGTVKEMDEAQSDILLNYGTALYEAGRYQEAESVFRACEAGNKARSEFNRAAIELGRGNFRTGWHYFEQRRAFLPNHTVSDLQDLPLWWGEPGEEPVGLYLEQGLGDMVQFLRYLPLAAQYRPVIFYCSEEVAGFIKNFLPSLPPSIRFSADHPATPHPVLQQSLLSLPYCLKRWEAPDTTPYLSAPEPPAPREQEEGRIRIGLCWAGNRSYAFDRRRSLNFDQISACFDSFSHPGAAAQSVQFVSLQRNVQTSHFGPSHYPEWLETPPVSTLEALGQAVSSCSLVMSVDSLVAHMAGAMGKPLWLLNRYGGDWRWRGPAWYEKTRIFSPSSLKNPDESWQDVREDIVRALKIFLEERACKTDR